MPVRQRYVPHAAMPAWAPDLDASHPVVASAFMLLAASQDTAYMRPYFSGVNGLGGYGIAGVSKLPTPYGRAQKRGGGGYLDEITVPSAISIDASGIYLWTTFWATGSCSGSLVRCQGASNQVDGRVDLNTDGSLTMLANGNVSVTTAAGIVEDGLHSVVMLNHRTGGVQRMWLDGVQVASASSTAQQGYFSDRMDCGRNTTGSWGSFFAGASLGTADEVAARLLADAPFGIFAPRRVLVPMSAGAVDILTTEVDTALAPGREASAAFGLAAETGIALALAGEMSQTAGLATEADAALAPPALLSAAYGLAAESDTALALTGGNAFGLATETDTAWALSGIASAPAGLALETDTALALVDGGAPSYVPSLKTFSSPSRARAFSSPNRSQVLASPSRAQAFTSPSRALPAFASPSRAQAFVSPRRVETFISPSRAQTFVSPARIF